MRRRVSFDTLLTRARRLQLNAHRAPGPTGVFILEGEYPPRVWRWEGWPANENSTRGRRPELDELYTHMALFGRPRD